MSRAVGYLGVVGIVLGLLAVDAAILTSSGTLSALAAEELRQIFQDRLEYSDLKASLSGVELRSVGFHVTKDRHKVLSADRLAVTISRKGGRFVPETIELDRARLALSDRLLESLSAEPSAGRISEQVQPEELPRIIVRGGSLQLAHAGFLEADSPIVFTLHRLEMVPVLGYKYFFGGRLEHRTLGKWKITGELDLETGAHDFVLRGDEVRLGSEVRAMLAADVQTQWDRYRPDGLAGVRIRFSRTEDGASSFVATVQPLGLSLRYAGFPYRVDDVRGEIDFFAEGLRIKHLTARHGDSRIWFDGEADGYGSEAGYRFRIEILGAALDDDLRAALQPDARAVWDKFRPRGTIDVRGSVIREHGEDRPVRNPLDVTFRGASCRFDLFPYDLEDVRGEIGIDVPTVTVKEISARHGPAEFRLHGMITDLEGDPGIDLSIRGRGVPFEPALKQALGPDLRRLWDDFSPVGSIDLDWRILKAAGGREAHHGEITALGNRILYREVPLPVRDVRGRIRIAPERIDLEHVTGVLDNGTVVAGGRWTPLEDGFQLDLSLDSQGAVLDERFARAMPKSVSELLRALRVGGRADYNFTMGMKREGGKEDLQYALLVNLSKAVIDTNVRVDDIEGELKLSGVLKDGKPEAFGSLAWRQARFLNKLVTDLTARYYVSGDIVSFQSIRGRAYGGSVEGTFRINSATTELSGEFNVDRLELRDFVRDTARYADRNLSGKVNLRVSNLTGNGTDASSLRGEGSMLITEGQLFEVPGVVNILSLQSGGRFKAARADFAIRDKRFIVDGSNLLAFDAEGGSVYGQGWVGFDGLYSFKVTSQTAPLLGIDFWLFRIPSLLFDAAKLPFRKEVTGSLWDEPPPK